MTCNPAFPDFSSKNLQVKRIDSLESLKSKRNSSSFEFLCSDECSGEKKPKNSRLKRLAENSANENAIEVFKKSSNLRSSGSSENVANLKIIATSAEQMLQQAEELEQFLRKWGCFVNADPELAQGKPKLEVQLTKEATRLINELREVQEILKEPNLRKNSRTTLDLENKVAKARRLKNILSIYWDLRKIFIDIRYIERVHNKSLDNLASSINFSINEINKKASLEGPQRCSIPYHLVTDSYSAGTSLTNLLSLNAIKNIPYPNTEMFLS